jgi:hypothetical protein
LGINAHELQLMLHAGQGALPLRNLENPDLVVSGGATIVDLVPSQMI